MSLHLFRTLVTHTASRYRPAGRFSYWWSRGKLGGDPIFMGVLRHKLIPDGGSVLDLGCGQGLLAAWLLAAADHHANGIWDHALLPAPPHALQLRGVERFPADVALAHIALGTAVDIRCGNICHSDFGTADVIVIMDVLHYINYSAQEDVLHRVLAALNPGGRLLLRVGNGDAGWKSRWSIWVDQAVVLARYRKLCTLWCRPMSDWVSLLESLGFNVLQLPMSAGTKFANVLLVAERSR